MSQNGSSEDTASPFRAPATRTISEDEITCLLELFKNVTLSFSGTEDIPPAAFDNDAKSATGGVDSKFQEIRNVALDLRRKFQDLLGDHVSQATYNELKSNYEEEVKKLKREIDEVIKNAKDNERLVVNRLNAEFQKMQDQAKKEIGDLEKEREAHRETQTLLCIAEINATKFDSAVGKFSALGDNQLLERIVADVFENNVENTEKILQFVQKLPQLEQHAISHSALYGEMNRNNNLKSQFVLLLAYNVDEAVGKIIDNTLSLSFQNQYTRLKDTLNPHVKDVINSWSVSVRNANYEEVKSFANKFDAVFARYVSRLIEQTYANNNDNTEMVLKFVKSLLSMQHGVIALDTLLKEMERNYHLKSSKLLYLAYRVKEVISSPSYNQLPHDYLNTLTRLKNALTALVEDVVKSWSVNVLNGDEEEFKTLANKSETDFELHLGKMVKHAYSNNRENTEKILNYFIELPSVNQRVIGMSALLQEMKRNDHLWTKQVFYLAYRMKEAMLDSNASSENKKHLESIKAGLPDTVVNIMWNVVCIKHVSCNEYFFGADDSDMDVRHRKEKRRLVFTYKYPGTRVEGKKGDWKFEPLNNGKSFRILNNFYGEYLYATDKKTVESKRHVGTWRDSGTYDCMEWDIDLCDDKKSIRIRNVWANEYMYAQSAWCMTWYSYSFRGVRTWTPGVFDKEMLWEVCKS